MISILKNLINDKEDNMTHRIIITGGAVHAHIDPVKIITNKFKGNSMKHLAVDISQRLKELNESAEIMYVGADKNFVGELTTHCKFIRHSGIEEYMRIISDLAVGKRSTFILGAAVANLIPMHPMDKKFPSHNYSEDDKISIDFKIAPRIIDTIKKHNPKHNLIGFKCLDGNYNELWKSAVAVMNGSNADLVVANNPSDIGKVFAITKERGTIQTFPREYLTKLLLRIISTQHYQMTKCPAASDIPIEVTDNIVRLVNAMGTTDFLHPASNIYPKLFPRGYGSIGMYHRVPGGGVYVTGRYEKTNVFKVGKKKDSYLEYEYFGPNKTDKPTKSAPLLHDILITNKNAKTVIHHHHKIPGLIEIPYYPSGTTMEIVEVMKHTDLARSFYIEGHGSYILLNSQNEVL